MSSACIWNFRCFKLFLIDCLIFIWTSYKEEKMSHSFDYFIDAISNSIFMTNKTIVVLIKSSDWNEWILIINFMIRRSSIDAYVNLIKPELSESVKPVLFTFSSIKNEVTFSKVLIEDERRDLLMMRNDFKETMCIYREKLEALKAQNLHILITVDRFNLIYLMNEDTKSYSENWVSWKSDLLSRIACVK
jgi:hypothetical protein